MSDNTSQSFLDHLSLLVRARAPLLYLTSHEEARTLRLLDDAARRLDRELVVWSSTRGFRDAGDRPWGGESSTCEPLEALDQVIREDGRVLFVLLDLHPWMEDPRLVRRLRDVARALRSSWKTAILLSPSARVPPELDKDLPVLDVPLPTEAEHRALLDRLLSRLQGRVEIAADPGLRERICQITAGLTEDEARAVFQRAVVDDGRFDASDLRLVIREKARLIRRSQLLEYFDPEQGLNEVGGLDLLKRWLDQRRVAFDQRARDFGLPPPRGLLLLGVQGCGKSLVAKAVAGHWQLPLLRLDLGALFGSYIGQSEANVRQAIKLASRMAPAVLWLDEIEKGMAGMRGEASDSGASARVLATILTWMQEKEEMVFVVATANSLSGLPPELLRKGRFDDIFFVDLPSPQERADILAVHLRRRKRDPRHFDLAGLAARAAGFSGAELEAAIVSGLYLAFGEGAALADRHLQQALSETVPLSRTMAEEIEGLRRWAAIRARPASSRS